MESQVVQRQLKVADLQLLMARHLEHRVYLQVLDLAEDRQVLVVVQQVAAYLMVVVLDLGHLVQEPVRLVADHLRSDYLNCRQVELKLHCQSHQLSRVESRLHCQRPEAIDPGAGNCN